MSAHLTVTSPGLVLLPLAEVGSFVAETTTRLLTTPQSALSVVPETVPPDVSLCLFRVLQEALHNGLRHSQARQFEVHLRGSGDAVHLKVRDEGVGFDVDAASRALGLGLTSMKERLKLVGGELVIESQSKRGTTVLARVPLRRSQGPIARS